MTTIASRRFRHEVKRYLYAQVKTPFTPARRTGPTKTLADYIAEKKNRH